MNNNICVICERQLKEDEQIIGIQTTKTLTTEIIHQTCFERNFVVIKTT